MANGSELLLDPAGAPYQLVQNHLEEIRIKVERQPAAVPEDGEAIPKPAIRAARAEPLLRDLFPVERRDLVHGHDAIRCRVAGAEEFGAVGVMVEGGKVRWQLR